VIDTYPWLHPTLGAVQMALTRLRNAMRKAGMNNLVNEMNETVYVPMNIKKQWEEQRESQLRRLNRTREQRTYKLEDCIKFLNESLQSDDWRLWFAAGMLGTGARFIELMRATFTQTPTPSDMKGGGNWITQSYVAKCRGSKCDICKPLFIITPDELLQIMRAIKSHFDRPEVKSRLGARMVSNTELSQHVLPNINRAVSKWWEDNGNGRTTSHKLRQIYGQGTWALYGSKQHIPLQTWLADHLGHVTQHTAAHYCTLLLDIT
jgi:hypothetical protein